MYPTELTLQPAPKQELDYLCNQWEAATTDYKLAKLAEPEFQEYVEGEEQWLQEQAYQHDRYLYADRI